MANTKIEDLPLLSPEDYNSFTDYIVIQKPGGSTYKMLAGSAGLGGGGAPVRQSYVHATSIGGPYTGGFHYGGAYDQNYGHLEYQEEGLLNSSSAWVLTMKLTTVSGNGGRVPNPLPSKDFMFSKPQGLDLVNNSISTNSIQEFIFFEKSYNPGGNDWNRAKLSCNLIFDTSSDLIKFENIVLLHYPIHYGKNIHYAWPVDLNIDTIIQGSIGPT